MLRKPRSSRLYNHSKHCIRILIFYDSCSKYTPRPSRPTIPRNNHNGPVLDHINQFKIGICPCANENQTNGKVFATRYHTLDKFRYEYILIVP